MQFSCKKPFHCFSSSHIFSRLFMNINIPSQDDGVLTAASDDQIQAIFSQKIFLAFSIQAIFVQKYFSFHFCHFSPKPTAKDLQCFFSKGCKKFCEISWNNPLEVEQITLLKQTTTKPWQKAVKPAKYPNMMMDVCLMWIYSVYFQHK